MCFVLTSKHVSLWLAREIPAHAGLIPFAEPLCTTNVQFLEILLSKFSVSDFALRPALARNRSDLEKLVSSHLMSTSQGLVCLPGLGQGFGCGDAAADERARDRAFGHKQNG